MTPTTSSIDTTLVPLGDIVDYSITSAAMPTDAASSSAQITSFTGTWTVPGNDVEFAGNQILTLNDPQGAGLVKGRVSKVDKDKNSARVSFDAQTFLERLAVTRKVLPIYNPAADQTYTVAAAVDHWTQHCKVFWDQVPGTVYYYHSFAGHPYAYCRNIPDPVSVTTNNGAALTYRVVNSRQVAVANSAYSINLNLPQYLSTTKTFLPTPIPKTSENKALVFSMGVDLQGSGNKPSWTLYLRSAGPTVNARMRVIQIAYGVPGFYLATAEYDNTAATPVLSPLFSSGTQPVGQYRLTASVADNSSGGIVITFTVINDVTGAIVYTNSITQTSTVAKVSTGVSSSALSYTPGTGTDSAIYGAYIATCPTPLTPVPVQKSLCATAGNIDCVPGFSGAAVWDNLRMLMAVHRLDLWYEDDILKTAPWQGTPVNPTTLTLGKITVQDRTDAQSVSVVSQKSTVVPYSATPAILFAANTVYQVAAGEKQVQTVQTKHSFDTLSQPACVTGISPYPYTGGAGQYVVTGSDGYIVDPTWWANNGGSLTVATTANSGEIQITITAPGVASVRAPYRISEGAAGRPALYVTGYGVILNPETLKVLTGNPHASQDVGETIDLPFVTNRLLAYNVATMASIKWAGPAVQLSLNELRELGQQGALSRRGAGALVKWNGNTFRVAGTTQSHSVISVTSTDQFNTIGQVNNSFPSGATIADANAWYGTKTIKDVNARPLKGTSL